MPYKVIKAFMDLQDDKHVYREGDAYPRKGRAAKKRAEELLTGDNLRGEPVIEEVKEDD